MTRQVVWAAPICAGLAGWSRATSLRCVGLGGGRGAASPPGLLRQAPGGRSLAAGADMFPDLSRLLLCALGQDRSPGHHRFGETCPPSGAEAESQPQDCEHRSTQGASRASISLRRCTCNRKPLTIGGPFESCSAPWVVLRHCGQLVKPLGEPAQVTRARNFPCSRRKAASAAPVQGAESFPNTLFPKDSPWPPGRQQVSPQHV